MHQSDRLLVASGKKEFIGCNRSFFGHCERMNLEFLVSRALEEDFGSGADITSEALIPPDARGTARLVCAAPGIVCGLHAVECLTRSSKAPLQWYPSLADGDSVKAGSFIGRLSGSVRTLLALERTALNFLTRLSGIATLAALYVATVRGTGAAILDTRKTCAWVALSGKVRGSMRRWRESSSRTLRRRFNQGQSPCMACRRRGECRRESGCDRDFYGAETRSAWSLRRDRG